MKMKPETERTHASASVDRAHNDKSTTAKRDAAAAPLQFPYAAPAGSAQLAILENPDRDWTFDGLHGRTILINDRKLILERVEANCRDLRIVREAGGEALLIDTPKGQILPTIEWLRAKFARDEARVLDMPSDPATISAFAELLDPMAILEANPRAKALESLAIRAHRDGIPIEENQVRDWMGYSYGLGPYDNDIDEPSARTIMRAMAKVRDGATVADLVNRSGRKKGSTPFPDATNRIINKDALSYYVITKSDRKDAYERHKLSIKKENTRLMPGAKPHKLIGRSAFYQRIKDLESPETIAMKFSEAEAKKRFEGSGEPIKANYCFEYGYVDATRLENVIVFDEKSRLPFIKPWVTAIMDVKSGAILACHVHAGDPRMETTLQTLLLSLSPAVRDTPAPSEWAA